MKKLLHLLIILIPYIGSSQENGHTGDLSDQGIHFEEGLNWFQVMDKARQESKIIFIDCFATWCGPCKAMEKEVYLDENVGRYFKSHFISVKVQMDSLTTDNEQVKSWYFYAHQIMQEYKISAFPSFLFLSSNGRIIDKEIGYKKTDDFLDMAKRAINPDKQYYALLENYKEGKRNYEQMPFLALMALKIGEKDIANTIALDYNDNYLKKLGREKLLTQENLELIGKFPKMIINEGSKGIFFQLFYDSTNLVDKIINYNGFSSYFIKAIITKEEINDKLFQKGGSMSGKQNWKKMKLCITRKYNRKYSESLILTAQFAFYRRTNNWQEFAKLREYEIKKFPPKPGTGVNSDAWILNGDAWDIFLNCNDRHVIVKALKWSDLSIKLESSGDDKGVNASFFDTNANLLYKLAKVDEAIKYEERAIEADQAMAEKNGKKKGYFFDEFIKNIAKMKKGEATWPQ